MNPQPFSVYLITIATVLNIIGAALNSVGIKEAFAIWIFSNLMCAIYYYGIMKLWWKMDEVPAKRQAQQFCVFIGTALIGWMRT